MKDLGRALITVLIILIVSCNQNGSNSDRQKPAETLSISLYDSLMQAYSGFNKFSGVALLAKGDSILFQKAYGMANHEWQVKNTINTRFKIGSLTKSFTAYLTFLKVQKGIINLDDKVINFIPELYQNGTEQIEIRHLLNHTSGLPSHTRSATYSGDFSKVKLTGNEWVEKISAIKLVHVPGKQVEYTNLGYILLGVVLERVSDRPFQTVLRDHILDTLKLDDTFYPVDHTLYENIAYGYDQSLKGPFPTEFIDPSIPFSAAGLYSTAGDLFDWTQNIKTYGLLNESLTNEMLKSKKGGAACGWFINNTKGEKIIYHGGRINGFSSLLRHYTKNDLTVILLHNLGSTDLDAIADNLVRISRDVNPQWPAARLDKRLYEQYTSKGAESMINDYRQIRDNNIEQINYSDDDLRNLALFIWHEHRDIDTAEQLLLYCITDFPESIQTHIDLGDLYMRKGNRRVARKYYRKAYKIDPGHVKAQQRIKAVG